jgi:hypothetical protein
VLTSCLLCLKAYESEHVLELAVPLDNAEHVRRIPICWNCAQAITPALQAWAGPLNPEPESEK